MERRSNYPIEIKAKIDLNTDLLLTELQQLLGKDRSKLLRLIIADFFNRNIDIIDEHTNSKSDKAPLIEAILKDFFNYNRETINQYIKFKNGNTRKKDGSAMSCVCQSRQRLVKLWMEAA